MRAGISVNFEVLKFSSFGAETSFVNVQERG